MKGMAARTSAGDRGPPDTPSRMTNTMPIPALKTNPATM
jgi:hypothetical protein